MAWPSGQRVRLTIWQSRVRVLLWTLAGFVLGCTKFKSSAMLVNSQLVASCHLELRISHWYWMVFKGNELITLTLSPGGPDCPWAPGTPFQKRKKFNFLSYLVRTEQQKKRHCKSLLLIVVNGMVQCMVHVTSKEKNIPQAKFTRNKWKILFWHG